jgi:hypothetical protein
LQSSVQPGVAAPTDDNSGGGNTTSGTNSVLNTATAPGSLITPQPNILDSFASYTYNIGWYLLTPDQATTVAKDASKVNVTQWSLLVQSGGAAPTQTAITQTGTASVSPNTTVQSDTKSGTIILSTTGRNKYFAYDYYLDNLEITIPFTKDAGAALLSFKVYEPNGLTLLPNLMNAVRDLYKQDSASPNNALYCLIIKFYGWDINGNLVTSPGQNTGTPGIIPSISNSVITRYYPFQITHLNFKAASKGVEYEIQGACQSFQYAASTGAGSIPYNIELTGQTVGQVLSGAGSSNTTPPTQGRDATASSSPAPVQTPFDSNSLAGASNTQSDPSSPNFIGG